MSVRLDRRGSLALVTLDRPARRNAFTMAMREDIAALFQQLEEDADVRVILLTGAGGHFCAGADTGEMGASDSAAFLHRMRLLHRMVRAIADVPKPTIAAVEGYCVGAGWSLALACDLIVAAPDARFSQLFGRIGFAPDAGAIWQLARLVGPMRAKEIVYSGRVIDAEEAQQLGLILQVERERPVLDSAIDLAEGIAQGPPLAHAMSKQLFDAAALPFDQYLGRELCVQPLLATTADHREALTARKDGRTPQFTGH